jgi:hypothetical protein
MNNIDKFYNLLDNSKISLLGYTFREESLKDELISKIPYHRVIDINSSFNLKSIIRDFKLDSIISDVKLEVPKFIVIDILDIRNSIYSSQGNYNTDFNLNTQHHLFSMIQKIGFDFFETQFKLIFTSPMNKTIEDNNFENMSFLGGNKPIYLSDLVFKLDDNKISVLKNRHGDGIKEINTEGLRKFNYICNYDYSE